MLVIRFARTGKKKQAYFRVVVAEKERAVGAKFVEILGNYDPHAKKLTVNPERLAFYLKNGAQPSNTVAKLLVKEKFELPKWVKLTEKKKAPKKEVEEKPAAPTKTEAQEVSVEGAESAEAEGETVVKESTEATEATEEAAEAPAEEGSSSDSNETPEDKEDSEATEETVEASDEGKQE